MNNDKANIDYRIESLGGLFSEHADKSDKSREERLMLFQEENPTSELPEHYKNEFNLPRALSVMAYEIDRLKQML